MILSTQETFEEDIKAPLVLVDFFAVWCGPCRMLTPVLEQAEAHYGGKLRIIQVNADTSPDLCQKFGVRGLPTLVLLRDGKTEAVKVGALVFNQLTAWLDPITDAVNNQCAG